MYNHIIDSFTLTG